MVMLMVMVCDEVLDGGHAVFRDINLMVWLMATMTKILWFNYKSIYPDNPTKVVGENMKALEVAEGKALEREEKFKEQVVMMMTTGYWLLDSPKTR